MNVKLLISLRSDVKHKDGDVMNNRQDRLRQNFAKFSKFMSETT